MDKRWMVNRRDDMLPASQETRRPTGGYVTFHTYLELHPAARDAIEQRLREYPEYHAWLKGFAPALLTALETELHQERRALGC
jgi:hypothetical protein